MDVYGFTSGNTLIDSHLSRRVMHDDASIELRLWEGIYMKVL